MTAAAEPRLRVRGVRKSFGTTHALRGVNLEVAPGEVHALIGENGAGKSTLMKILSGAYEPDMGEITLNGERYAPRNPHHARKTGIEMIYQELSLAPHLTVEENILLGAEPSRLGLINGRRRREMAAAALAELNETQIPLGARVESLSVAAQQMVEIARALAGSPPQVLIMDEPTSSLTRVDAENLFRTIGHLKSKGVSIIYISHFLEECQRLADRYTVLRDGESVGGGVMAEAGIPEIIHLMVGRKLEEIYPRAPHAIGEPILKLDALAGKSKPASASLTLRRGEILGIAGLVGAGRTEMLRAIFGLDRVKSGRVEVVSVESTKATPRARLRQGVGLLSENRKEEGLMLSHSIADNMTLTRLEPFATAGFIRGSQQKAAAESWMKRLRVRARDASQPIGELSGGNQQKIAISRLLHHGAEILLFDEPTRGIDVASKAQIYQLVGELAAEGKGIIFVSSYLPELMGVCDTLAVMCRGVLGQAKPVGEWTEHSIIAAAIGQEGN